MTNALFRRRRVVDGQEVREPTSLAIALALAGGLLVVALCLAVMFFWPALGQGWWLVALVAALLGCLVAVRQRGPFRRLPAATRRQAIMGHVLGAGWKLTVALLASWLGLAAWSEVSAGEAAPPPKADAQLIRVVTWNIHCTLPEHHRVGVGRDDGGSGGEHCAIYFDARRFDELASGTFWLEEPTDRPRGAAALDVKRLCTWVRLRDRASGRVIRVYNTHQYLTEAARRPAVSPILAHIAAGDPEDAVLLTADFNAPPSAPSRRLFGDAELTDSAALAGQPTGTRTFHLYGIPLRCLDGVLVDGRWRVRQHSVLKSKPGNVYPSDHFGVLADFGLHE